MGRPAAEVSGVTARAAQAVGAQVPSLRIDSDVRRAVDDALLGWTSAQGANVVYRYRTDAQAPINSVRRYRTQSRGVLVFERAQDPARAFAEARQAAEREARERRSGPEPSGSLWSKIWPFPFF